MLAIIDGKPDSKRQGKKGVVKVDPYNWAKRFNAAFSYNWLGLFWGTDDEAITAVIAEIPSKKAFADTMRAYQDLYGVKLIDDWIGDSTPMEVEKHLKVIFNK